MKSYTLKEGAAYAIVPGHGKLYPGQTIMGDFDVLVPGTLREVPSTPEPVPAPEPAPTTLVSVSTVAAPKPGLPDSPAPQVEAPETEGQGADTSVAGDVSDPETEGLGADAGVVGAVSDPAKTGAEEIGDPSSPPPAKSVDLPPPDMTPKVTTSSTVAGPQPPKGGKGSRR